MKRTFFDQTYIAGHTLMNRFVVAPMTRFSASEAGVPTAQMAGYYERFARGGFAMIITEGVYTDDVAAKCDVGQPGMTTREQSNGWEQITSRIRQSGALAICQLMHAGALSHIVASPWAPSAIQPVGHPFSARDRNFFLPTEMTQTDIRFAVDGYANAAKLADEAGFDGVEIHAANGYLPDQFITPHTNSRTDKYGGSAENRMRFVAKVADAIRRVVPKEFIVGLRMSEGKVNDLAYRWESGPEEARALFAEVKKIDPDYLHIAAEGGGWKRECQYADGSSSTGIAVQMLTCPVIANGGLHDFDLADELLNSHQADLLAIGRYALANPDLPLKLKRGERPIPFDKAMLEPGLHLSDTERYFQKLDCRASI